MLIVVSVYPLFIVKRTCISFSSLIFILYDKLFLLYVHYTCITFYIGHSVVCVCVLVKTSTLISLSVPGL